MVRKGKKQGRQQQKNHPKANVKHLRGKNSGAFKGKDHHGCKHSTQGIRHRYERGRKDGKKSLEMDTEKGESGGHWDTSTRKRRKRKKKNTKNGKGVLDGKISRKITVGTG